MSNQINEGAARYSAEKHDQSRPELSGTQGTQSPQQLVTDHLDLWTSTVTPKSTSGRGRGSGKSSKLELTGIKKLRELILELAVRGKLVAQNPDDERASKLLERIEAEKAQLIKDGKLKKQKPLAPVSEDEKPFELPEGWEWVRLGIISADIHYGYTASANENVKEYRLLRITDIQNDKVNWETVPGCEINGDQAEQYLLRDGDILIARTGGTIGKSYLVSDLSVQSVFASYLIRVRRLASGHPPYSKVFLGSQLYWSQLLAASMGTGQPNVNGNSLKGLVYPLPPLAEQQRIVAKVDELMALCDQLEQKSEHQLTAHQQLTDTLLATLTDSANAQELNDNWQRLANHFDLLFSGPMGAWAIDRLKDTILQLAVMGKLVPQNPDDEPPSKLLEHIEEEKAQLVKEGKIKKPKKLPPVSDDEKPFELPQGWAFARLGQLIKISSGDGLTSAQMATNGTIPVFGGNGVNGYHDKANINEKTLVIGRVGFYCGSIHITPELAWVTDNAFITTFDTRLFSLEYLALLLSITNLKENENATAQPVISGKKIYPIPICFPPLAEQQRIVAKVDELMALCDQLKERLQQASGTEQHLTNAIVEQALN